MLTVSTDVGASDVTVLKVSQGGLAQIIKPRSVRPRETIHFFNLEIYLESLDDNGQEKRGLCRG